MAEIKSIVKSSLILTAASSVEFMLQLAIPMVFVRHLSTELFSEYRFLWLLAGTMLALLPAYMPQALFYFLPRASGIDKTTYIGNVIVYLFGAGAIAVIFLSPLNPLVSGSLLQLSQDSDGLVLFFLCLWMVVSINNSLPICEGRFLWQASTDVLLAIFRTAFLLYASIVLSNFKAIVVALLMDACLRVVCLFAYLYRRGSSPIFKFKLSFGFEQIKYSTPFAVGNGLFLLRSQLDQWIVALVCGASNLAMFAVGAVLLPLSALIKQPLYNSNLPRISAAFAAGDLNLAKSLIYRGVCYTVLILVPAAMGFFLISHELIAVIYTDRYLNALPVMRIYLLGIGFGAVGVSYVLPAIEMGRFAVRNNVVCLIVSGAVGLGGAFVFGPVGAALGSLAGLLLSELWSLAAVARVIRVSIFELLPLGVLFGVFVLSASCCYTVTVIFYQSLTPPIYLLLAKGGTYVGLLGLATTLYWLSVRVKTRRAS